MTLIISSVGPFGFDSFMLIPEIIMIGVGATLLIIGIYFTAKGETYSSGFGRAASTRPTTIRRRYRSIRRTPEKKAITNCPSCKAPLKKPPPCECEYCGRMIN